MASPSKRRVVVVGAGVIGMSAAVHLTERFGSQLDVTVVADQFTPDTTSDKAGAVIIPIDFSNGPGDERVKTWTKDTFKHLHSLYETEAASEIELCLLSGYDFKKAPTPDPWWKDCVFGFRRVSPDSIEAKLARIPPDCVTVWSFITYMVNCRTYLPWLMKRFQGNGGRIEKRKVVNLTELSGYDIIVTCVGLGAVSLLGDTSLMPVRGQGVLVRAPWVKQFMINYTDIDNIVYILPRSRDILLGGTAQENQWSEEPDPQTSEEIRQHCEALMPGLASAEVIDSWAGLRPLRREIRVEMEPTKPPVVHCYGHGGQGIVLHWGCALEIGRLVEQCMESNVVSCL